MSTYAKESWSLRMVSPLEPGIVCIDMDRMLDFYTKVLGLKFVTDAEASPEMSKEFGTSPNGFRIIRLQTPYGERIKLVQPKKIVLRQSQVPEWVFEGQGIAYITFVVIDVQEVTVRLKKYEVELMSKEPVEIRKGITAIFAKDPEGNFLEFVEYADLASYRPDLFKWRLFLVMRTYFMGISARIGHRFEGAF
jgi:catechol 2,3-dioxygenase-like lactoylglutathione lyase family enzyme